MSYNVYPILLTPNNTPKQMKKAKIKIERIGKLMNFGSGINLYINIEKVVKIQNGLNDIYAQIDWCKRNLLKLLFKKMNKLNFT